MKSLLVSLLLLPLISASEDETDSSLTSSSTVAPFIEIPLREYTVSFDKSPLVNGIVSAPDEMTLFVQNFTFNGADRDAFFWAGEIYGDDSKLPDHFNGSAFLNPGGEPDSWSYEEIEEMEEKESLGVYEMENVTLHLPEGMKVSQLKFLAVWSPDMDGKRHGWGHVKFPEEGLRIPSGENAVFFSSGLLCLAFGFTQLL